MTTGAASFRAAPVRKTTMMMRRRFVVLMGLCCSCIATNPSERDPPVKCAPNPGEAPARPRGRQGSAL